MYEAFVCPLCMGSINVVAGDPDESCECLDCNRAAPLWYLRIMGVHECERDDMPDLFERHLSVPVISLRDGEYGRSRIADEIRACQ